MSARGSPAVSNNSLGVGTGGFSSGRSSIASSSPSVVTAVISIAVVVVFVFSIIVPFCKEHTKRQMLTGQAALHLQKRACRQKMSIKVQLSLCFQPVIS